ncbi:hypothetical protein LTR66_000120 [Elasticomyces elasticus]|nr:hypothetical protein LTR50_000668 [Elasticomyces elasticus]KAK5001151.1 hypothetical protein LTR66_000120 [Elasticomyces elasticus]KAK5010101.1 hypothetical protein LTR28_011790 [Elasticomyces elasticus]
MQLCSFALLSLCCLIASVCAADSERALSVYAWPLSSSTSQQLAKISYDFLSLNASVTSYDAIPPQGWNELVRVGFYSSAASHWRGIVTSGSNFAPDLEKKLTLHVDNEGEVYHIGYSATQKPAASAKSSKSGKDKGDKPAALAGEELKVEIVRQKAGPQPYLNKPVVLNPDGKVESEEPQKSFLQKYWWAFALFLLLQVVMGSGGKE